MILLHGIHLRPEEQVFQLCGARIAWPLEGQEVTFVGGNGTKSGDRSGQDRVHRSPLTMGAFPKWRGFHLHCDGMVRKGREREID